MYFGSNVFELPDSYVNCMRRIGIVPFYNEWGALGFKCEKYSDISYAIDVIKRTIHAIIHMVDEIPPKEEFKPIEIQKVY